MDKELRQRIVMQQVYTKRKFGIVDVFYEVKYIEEKAHSNHLNT